MSCCICMQAQSVLCTQADIHAAYGGVVPNLAMEAHKAAMDSCIDTAVRQAGIKLQDLDAVAVSIGPGLSPCLHVSSHHACVDEWLRALQMSACDANQAACTFVPVAAIVHWHHIWSHVVSLPAGSALCSHACPSQPHSLLGAARLASRKPPSLFFNMISSWCPSITWRRML